MLDNSDIKCYFLRINLGEKSFLNTLETKFGRITEDALFSGFIRSVMVWSEAKDYIMLKEVAAEGGFNSKPGSREGGTSWQKVANKLNSARCLE